jgi:hypothetical protein
MYDRYGLFGATSIDEGREVPKTTALAAGSHNHVGDEGLVWVRGTGETDEGVCATFRHTEYCAA